MYYIYQNEELFAGDMVTFPDGDIITADMHDSLEYPYKGWMWFDTEEEARIYYGIEN